MAHAPHTLHSATCLTAALLCTVPNLAFANPQGGVVSAGQATISESAKKLDVHQQSQKAVIDWRGFDIAADEHTEFHQPNSNALAVNRVNSNSASNINGRLTANGNIVVINQNGVLFGQNAQVDVNGIVATTADIDNDDAMNSDTLEFDKPGNPNAAVVNAGQITAKEAGLVGLVAPNVINSGVITARLGRAELASGDTTTVDFYGDDLLKVAVSDEVTSQLVANSGIIAADGGTIALTASAGKDIVNSLIVNSGTLRAQSVGVKNGEIIIASKGSNKTSKSGNSTVMVAGVLDVSGRKAGEHGGKITVTGDNIALLNGTLIDASGHTGLSGTTAGKEKSDKRDGSAGGEILIGGDYLGGGDTPTAKNLYVGAGVLVLNDALNSGDAGRTIFWSDMTTEFYGNLYARALGGKSPDANTWQATAGGNAGDGGFVETSGHGHLDAGGYVDLTASNGNRGTYFLDPTNITIYGNVDPAFISTAGDINLSANLKLWLDASDTANVNLTYNSLGTTATGTSGTNTITVDANTGLVVGARIRLGAAGAVTAASTLGADTYTVTNISGTTITLSSNLTTNYTGSGVYEGYVSQFTDKSGQANNAIQVTAAYMPLWISGASGQNGNSVIQFDGSNDHLLTINNLTAATFFIQTQKSGSSSSYESLFSGGAFLEWLIAGSSGFPSAYTGFSTAAGTLYENGDVKANNALDLIMSGPIIAAKILTTPSTAQGGIGYGPGEARYFGGKINEVIDYNTTLSSSVVDLVNQYQSAKWGIALTPPGTGATEVAKATASDGYSVFTTRYLERLSQSADISLQATNDINLDFKGDTLNFATAGRSLTMNAGNQITSASTGTITTNAGNISLTGTNGILFNNAFNLNSGGGNITLASPVTLGANLTTNSGAGTTTFSNTVNGAHNLTSTAGTFSLARALGGTTALGAVNLTSTNALTLPSITASSITASTASGNISGAGGLVTNSGAISLDAANDLDLTSIGIVSNNGNVTLESGRDTLLSTAIFTGTGDFIVSAVRDIFVTAIDLTTGLVGHWAFDEGAGTNANDSTANNNDGTLNNGPSWSSSNPYGLSSNYSLSFDGTNDYVAAPTAAAQMQNESSWAVSFWAAASSYFGASQGAFSLNTNGASSKGIIIYPYDTNGGNGVRVYANDLNGVGIINNNSQNLADNLFHHFVFLSRSSTDHEIFVDGVSAGTSALNFALDSGLNQLNIGSWNGSQIFNGKIDDVRIYNTALSSTQVSQLYAPQVDWNTGTTTFTAGRNASFDLNGETMALASGKSMTINAGDSIASASAGVMTATKNAGVGGDITMAAGGSGTLSTSNLTLNANSGGAINLTSPGAMTLGSMNATTILARSTGAASDLTIAAGKTLTASAANTALTLASGRHFINSAGAGALATPAGRWLVYSTNPANDTVGSLANEFRRFNCSYSGGCAAGVTIPAAGDGLIYSYQPTLTATPSAIAALTYGGAVPSLTGYAYTLSGYLGSDSGSDNVTGSLNGSTTYTQGSNVGSYNINNASGSLASALGYGFSYANNATAITVGQRALTVAADAKSKFYGAADPSLTYQITSGSLYGSDVFTGELSRTAGETVVGGPYAILQNTLSLSSNYNLTYTGTSLTINPAALSITANNQSKTYGSTLTFAGTEFGSSGLQNSETIGSVSLSSAGAADTASVAGGPYAITASAATGGTFNAGNYTITYHNGALTVTPRSLGVTADAKSKTYGAADAALTYQITSGSLYGSDEFSGALSRAPGETVGGGLYAILQNTLSMGSNYTLSYSGANLTINPATLTVTANNATRMQGQPNPIFTASYSGFQYSDDASLVSRFSIGSTAETASIAGNYDIIPSGGTAANYALDYVNGLLTVTPFTLLPNSVTRASQTPIINVTINTWPAVPAPSRAISHSPIGTDTDNAAGKSIASPSTDSPSSEEPENSNDKKNNERKDSRESTRVYESVHGLLKIDPALAIRLGMIENPTLDF